MSLIIEMQINGTKTRIDTDGQRSLLSVLRDDRELTGCKYGCGEGKCGACTVLIDGKAVRSCVTEISSCAGKEVTTIEGLATGDKLHPLQAAFLECEALQCGYCTPGMILSGVSLLKKNPDPSPQEIVRSLEGNICRCGTYARIVQAVRRAAETMKGSGQ